ncbi:hypothetical protein AB3S75_043067 [Citrus x aurantiifolia]
MVGHKMLYSLCQLQIVSDDLQDKPCETLLVSLSNASIPLTSNFNVFYKYRGIVSKAAKPNRNTFLSSRKSFVLFTSS